jgi:hypothetical protein
MNIIDTFTCFFLIFFPFFLTHQSQFLCILITVNFHKKFSLRNYLLTDFFPTFYCLFDVFVTQYFEIHFFLNMNIFSIFNSVRRFNNFEFLIIFLHSGSNSQGHFSFLRFCKLKSQLFFFFITNFFLALFLNSYVSLIFL